MAIAVFFQLYLNGFIVDWWENIVAIFQHQIWELLPQFLNSAAEFEKYFPELAPVLGSALSERADLRMVVLSSIRSAVRFAQQPDAPAERIVCLHLF